jgi:anhydro-N-acetylmuramic acid kinase
MNKNIEKLCSIAKKEERFIIGLMSGTSVDGLDVALCSIKGSGSNTNLKLLNFETIPFDKHFKEEIKTILSKRAVDLEKVCMLNAHIAIVHAEIILDCLKKWNLSADKIDLLASHGQSIYHAPAALHKQKGHGNSTLQIGDGDHLAVKTGITTLSDFRQKHIAAGGEGAPLAIYGDFLIFSKQGESRIMLNIGGIANFTFLPGSLNAAEVFCTDVGPGNTLMDAYIQQHFPGKYYDHNAEIAMKGNVNIDLLKALKNHEFFDEPFPKTTGPELFNLQFLISAQTLSKTLSIATEDVMATLNKLTADTIVDAINKNLENVLDSKIYLSGGGMHNPLLRKSLQQQLSGIELLDTEKLGINPDAKEAVLFAILANEAVCGNSNFSGRFINVSMGKVSFPW